MHLLLFAQSGLEESVRAFNQLKEAFPKAKIEVIIASEAMTEIYSCPFVKEDGADGAFYGTSGIETFIRFRQAEGNEDASGQGKKKRQPSRRRLNSISANA